MERHFTFPVLVAAAIHGGLLFGWPRGDAPRPTMQTYVYPFGDPPLPMPLEEKPEIDVVPDDKPAKGDPDVYRPDITDTPRIADIRDFQVPLVQTEGPIVKKPQTTIPTELPGERDGVKSAIRGGIIPSNFLDNPPRTRSQAPISYPYEAKSRGLHGTVTVEFTVDENGRVLDPRAIDSTDRVFEAAAVAGVAKWRFEPGRREGRVVRFRMAVPIQFSLNE